MNFNFVQMIFGGIFALKKAKIMTKILIIINLFHK